MKERLLFFFRVGEDTSLPGRVQHLSVLSEMQAIAHLGIVPKHMPVLEQIGLHLENVVALLFVLILILRNSPPRKFHYGHIGRNFIMA